MIDIDPDESGKTGLPTSVVIGLFLLVSKKKKSDLQQVQNQKGGGSCSWWSRVLYLEILQEEEDN